MLNMLTQPTSLQLVSLVAARLSVNSPNQVLPLPSHSLLAATMGITILNLQGDCKN